MSKLVEKIKEAIWIARGEAHGHYPPDKPYAELPEMLHSWLEAEARAALAVVLEEMREPSEGMADKGENELVCGPRLADLETSPSESWAAAKSCWRGMLAQFKKENTPSTKED